MPVYVPSGGGPGSVSILGTIDCSTNPNYPAADQGDIYIVSVAGKIGGALGPDVGAGDFIVCEVDGTPSGTHAAVGANWTIIPAATSVNYTNASPVPIAVGRIPAGQTFNNATPDFMWDSLLYYTGPTVSSLCVPSPGTYEYGDAALVGIGVTLTPTTVKGTNNISSLGIAGVPGGFSYSYPAPNPAGGLEAAVNDPTDVAVSKVYTITVGDGIGTGTVTKTFTLLYPIYYGAGVDGKILTPQDLRTDLTNLLSAVADRSLNFSPDIATLPRMYYAYPATAAKLKAIGGVKDSNGFDVTADWSLAGNPGEPSATVSITGLDGNPVNYYVYEFDHDTGDGSAVTYAFDHV